MFTGDRSGDFLFAALHRAGYANQARSCSIDDGLELSGALRDRGGPLRPARRTSRRRSSVTPAPPYLAAELEVLTERPCAARSRRLRLRSAVAALAEAAASACDETPARFAHGLEVALPPPYERAMTAHLLCSYHPSQRNVFTGLLTAEMFDKLLARARELGA